MASVIKGIFAREILDSRGNPTVEVELSDGKIKARAAVPSGASTGSNEALELRDGGSRYNGKGVLKAAGNVNKIISKEIKGMACGSWKDIESIDKAMIALDGTASKSNLGANAILGVSLAAARLCALSNDAPLYSIFPGAKKNAKLPMPFMNVINGGKHAGTSLRFQEFMIAPKAKTFSESLRIGAETYHALKGVIEKRYGKLAINVGDEGGFAPDLKTASEALELLNDAIAEAGYGKDVRIAMDCAASEFYENSGKDKGKYSADGKHFTAAELSDHYKNLIKNNPIISIEDPFHEEQFKDFAKLTEEIGDKVQIVGDDLLVTNVKRIDMALKARACNALLLKVNQIGTVTEAVAAAKLAMDNGWKVMVSHRSGETEDTFIADLVVGLGTGQIKSGAPCRAERTSKYNQLLRIEQDLNN